MVSLQRGTRDLEAGRLHITSDLYERIVELSEWAVLGA